MKKWLILVLEWKLKNEPGTRVRKLSKTTENMAKGLRSPKRLPLTKNMTICIISMRIITVKDCLFKFISIGHFWRMLDN